MTCGHPWCRWRLSRGRWSIERHAACSRSWPTAAPMRVLGVHLVAQNAGDVVHAGVLAVRFHLTVKDLTDTFAPYLPMSEGLKLAAQSFERDVSKLSCCAA